MAALLRIDVVCVGRLEDYLAVGCAEYARRIGGMAKLTVTELPAAPLHGEEASPALIHRALAQEGQALLAHVRRGSRLVALCVEGQPLTSEQLAQWMSGGALQGNGDVTFVIGSSHGLDEALKRQAQLRLSMSRMTFPHQLARLMLLEQIYRALNILQGGRYHK